MITHLCIIVEYSSIIQYSAIIIGPPSAIMVTLGWTTVPPPMVMSPSNVQSSQTVAPGSILTLKKRYAINRSNQYNN